ncbi:MAG: hypothetical protein WAU11_12355 [Ignavibacteriaceae bacterium]
MSRVVTEVLVGGQLLLRMGVRFFAVHVKTQLVAQILLEIEVFMFRVAFPVLEIVLKNVINIFDILQINI